MTPCIKGRHVFIRKGCQLITSIANLATVARAPQSSKLQLDNLLDSVCGKELHHWFSRDLCTVLQQELLLLNRIEKVFKPWYFRLARSNPDAEGGNLLRWISTWTCASFIKLPISSLMKVFVKNPLQWNERGLPVNCPHSGAKQPWYNNKDPTLAHRCSIVPSMHTLHFLVDLSKISRLLTLWVWKCGIYRIPSSVASTLSYRHFVVHHCLACFFNQ